jgi:hypothetical protein
VFPAARLRTAARPATLLHRPRLHAISVRALFSARRPHAGDVTSQQCGAARNLWISWGSGRAASRAQARRSAGILSHAMILPTCVARSEWRSSAAQAEGDQRVRPAIRQGTNVFAPQFAGPSRVASARAAMRACYACFSQGNCACSALTARASGQCRAVGTPLGRRHRPFPACAFLTRVADVSAPSLAQAPAGGAQLGNLL